MQKICRLEAMEVGGDPFENDGGKRRNLLTTFYLRINNPYLKTGLIISVQIGLNWY